MQALFLKSIGENYNLEYIFTDKPSLGKDHALIRVAYCGMNHLDFLIATGRRTGSKKLPHILGSEIVGEIRSIGKNKDGFKKRDKVCIYPWTYCGSCPSCKQGNIQICDKGGTIGRTTRGGYAEYVSIPIHNLVKIPDELSLKNVCSITLSGTTAYHLIRRADIPDKSLVLVTGATGGVGVLLLQMLKQKKCTVVVITSSKVKINKLKKLGVHDILMLHDFPDNIKKKYPARFSYIVDIMGGKVWSGCIEMLAKNGRISFCSTSLEDMGTVHVGSAFSREIKIIGSYGGTMDDLKATIELLKKGSLQPVIDSTVPLKNAQLALAKLQNREIFGKILLKP
jgi:D-arabinose 1-dehydrogenase-like Zn-dependent alcohol dehydrogenase